MRVALSAQDGDDSAYLASMRSSEHPVMVIGGGVVGLATAYALLKKGLRVDVLEAAGSVGLGASFANGGVLTPALSQPWNSPGIGLRVARSGWRSDSDVFIRGRAIPSLLRWGTAFLRNAAPARFYRAAEAAYKLCTYSVDLMSRLSPDFRLAYLAGATGTLAIFASRASLEVGSAVAQRLAGVGLRYQSLDGDQTIEREPALNSVGGRIAGGLFFPDDERGDAYLYCQVLAKCIEQCGGRVRLGTTVKALIREGDRIIGVQTPSERIICRSVVVAGGVQTVGLLHALGVKLPVCPVKGYSLTLDVRGLNSAPHVTVVSDEFHAAITRLGDSLRLAGTAEFDGYSTALRPERIRNLASLLKAIFPNIAARVDVSQGLPWAGLRPVSADGIPFIGATRLRGLYVNTGHGHVGWTMAMGSGALLADLLTGAAPQIDPSPYAAVRAV